MRRLHFGLLGAGLPVLVFSLALVGCGGGDTGGDVKKDTSNDKKTPPAKVELKPIEPGKGVIKGTVALNGGAPDFKKMDADLMAMIVTKGVKDFCTNGAKPSEVEQQHYRIKDGKVSVTDRPFIETKEQLGGMGRDIDH